MLGQSTYIECEPPKAVASKLMVNERVLFATRMHWVRIAPPVCSAVAATILAVIITVTLPPDVRVLANVVWLGVIVVWGWMAYNVWNWAHDWFIATHMRLLRVTGYFDRNSSTMPVKQVTDLDDYQSFWGDVMGYGSFRFESAGQKQGLEHVDFVPHYYNVYFVLFEHLFGSDGERYRDLRPSFWHRNRDAMTKLRDNMLWFRRRKNEEVHTEHPDVSRVDDSALGRLSARADSTTGAAAATGNQTTAMPAASSRAVDDDSVYPDPADAHDYDADIRLADADSHDFTEYTNVGSRFDEDDHSHIDQFENLDAHADKLERWQEAARDVTGDHSGKNREGMPGQFQLDLADDAPEVDADQVADQARAQASSRRPGRPKI